MPAVAGARGEPLPLLAVGAVGWAFVAAGLGVGFPGLIAPGVAVLGAGYALSLGSGLDGRAPLYAGLLLLVAELAFWSFELGRAVPSEAGTLRERAVLMTIGAVGAVAVAATMLALTAVPALPGGVAWEVIGIAAAVGALAFVVALARPRDQPGS